MPPQQLSNRKQNKSFYCYVSLDAYAKSDYPKSKGSVIG